MAPKQKQAKKKTTHRGPGLGSLISIRNCNVTLSVFCIAISASVCIFLDRPSAEDAIRRTKVAGEMGLNGNDTGRTYEEGNGGCWSTATFTADLLTKRILDQMGGRIKTNMQQFTDRPRRIVKEMGQWLAGISLEQSLNYEWQRDNLQPYMWAALWETMPHGMTTIGSITTKGQFIMMYQPPDTAALPYDEFKLETEYTTLPEGVSYNDWGSYHEIQLIVNNGTDYGPVCDGANYYDDGHGESCRSWYGAAEPMTGDFRKTVNPDWGGSEPGRRLSDKHEACDIDYCDRCSSHAAAGKPVGPMANHTKIHSGSLAPRNACPDIWAWHPHGIVQGSQYWLRSLETLPEPGANGVSSPRTLFASIKTSYMQVVASTWTNYGADPKLFEMAPQPGADIRSPRPPDWTILGTLWAGADIRSISIFMQQIKIGTADLRVFAAQASDWERLIEPNLNGSPHHWSTADGRERGKGTLMGLSHGPVRMPICIPHDVCTGQRKGSMRFFMRFLKDVEATDPVIRAIAQQAQELGTNESYSYENLAEIQELHGKGNLTDAQAQAASSILNQNLTKMQAYETCCRGGPKDKMHKLGESPKILPHNTTFGAPCGYQHLTIKKPDGWPRTCTPCEITEQGKVCDPDCVCNPGCSKWWTKQGLEGQECIRQYDYDDDGCPFVQNGYNDEPGDVPCSPEWPTRNFSDNVKHGKMKDFGYDQSTQSGWGQTFSGDKSPIFDGYETIARAPKGYVEMNVKSVCTDDPNGYLNPVGMTCQMAALYCKDNSSRIYSRHYCCPYIDKNVTGPIEPEGGYKDFDMSMGPGWYQNGDTPPMSLDRSPWVFPPGMKIKDICPKMCHTCPEERPMEPYYVRATRHDDGYGLDWWVVMAIDRKFIFAEIDRQTIATQKQIVLENEKVEVERKKDLKLLYGLVAAVGFVLMMMSVAFASFIVRPLNKLQAQMKCVAQMNLEKVNLKEQPSKLVEVKRMQRDFKKMVQCIRKYREFLPMSVLEEVMGGHAEDDAAEAAVEAQAMMPIVEGSRASSQQGSAVSGSGAHSAARGTSQSSKSSVSLASSASQGTQLAQVSKALTKGITKKKITFIAVGFKGWHTHFQKVSDNDMIAAHAGLLSAQIELFNKNKGVPDAFCGDRVMASFNAVRPIATHKVASCSCALSLLEMSDACSKDGLDGLVDEGHRKGAKNAAGLPQASVAVASGDAKVGNMGCDGMKKYAHMSVVVAFTYALERHASKLAAGCLLDKAVHCDVENNFTLREAGTMLLLKRGQKPCEVHQLAGRKEASEDEWMYQLEEQNKHQDEFFHWKAAVKAAKEECWDDASASLQAAVPEDTPEAMDPAAVRRAGLLVQLREAVAAKVQVPPADASTWH